MAKKQTFEESMKRLEKIVEELERGDFPLEESIAKFEEGLALGNACKEILDKAEARVRELVERAEKETRAQEGASEPRVGNDEDANGPGDLFG